MIDGKKLDSPLLRYLMSLENEALSRVSPETWEAVKPKLNTAKGVAIMTGTGGGLNGSNNFRELWEKSFPSNKSSIN